MTRIELKLELKAKYDGVTQVVTICLGRAELGTYRMHTRYEETALAVANEALCVALTPLIDQAMDAVRCERVKDSE